MVKFYISLCFLLVQVNIIWAQNTSVKELINMIKLNESYLYGESNNKIEEAATFNAKNELLRNANNLREENGLSLIDEHIINDLYQKLLYRRGELTYVFTYLSKGQVLNLASSSAVSCDESIIDNDIDIDPNQIVNENTQGGEFFKEVLLNVLERQMVENVYGYLQKAKEKNQIEDFSKAGSLTEIPDDAFIVIYDRMYHVVAILSNKIDGKRMNVKTNKPELITKYSGHGVIWYINK